ncbi:MAG: GGDEF domain-containing protein [Lachnospiraceae bacterium]|nr:GGDEF domain-containing protein [Lachnospiraceae bacterium]
MKQFIKTVRQILTGNLQITDRQKYTAFITSVMMVHFFLTCLFGYYKVTPLFIFNIISVTVYLVCTQLLRRNLFFLVYCITYTEIVIHSFVAVICVGWQYGFSQYLIAIIPVCYYMCFTMNSRHRKILIATGSALLAVLAFLSCKVLSFYIVPAYEPNLKALELWLYIFNSVCTFAFLILFSLIFVFEMKLSSDKLRHQNAILDKLASTDPLTGLYNRRSMNIFLSQALESGARFCVIMSDIDDFKHINDSYGHDFGDVVLREISHIIVEQVKEYGYVCRWGGEEILILISNHSKETACRIAENIRRKVANHVFEPDGKWIHCSLTLGVSAHEKANTIEETITKADYNLYVGKRNGKNVVIS